MADGSPEDRTGPKQINDLTFSAPVPGHGDTKECSEETLDGGRVNLSFYSDQESSESWGKSDKRGVAANGFTEFVTMNSRKSRKADADEGEDRKKRCFDRYDSSESSDSGVAVLSPTESGTCSSSDITEPGSPRSPESPCSTSEDSTGAGARMPPWASDPAPPRRLAAQPAPVRRPHPPIHRRITEYFNHKMKPQNGLKRDSNSTSNEDSKRKCLPKNGVTQDLEKYISYLSQTLSPKVLIDVSKQAVASVKKQANSIPNSPIDCMKPTDLSKMSPNTNVNGMRDFGCKEIKDKVHTTMDGFMAIRHGSESYKKEKLTNGLHNGLVDRKKQSLGIKKTIDSSANCSVNRSLTSTGAVKRKIPMSNEVADIRIAPATSASQSPKKPTSLRPDTRVNGIVSSTTKLDSRMNGVTCGSNNLSLHSNNIKSPTIKKEPVKKPQPTKRKNRKSSACIANSKNLTWSKANNLKVQLQQQNCVNSMQNSTPSKNILGEASTAPKMNIPNGVRQVSMTVNGSLGNLNVPVTNLQNCHQLNMPQPCNGTVPSNNLTSFVAVPQNVMLTTLRIPQNGIPAQSLTQQNNMNTFNRQNVNVTSPSKLNGQFVFPLMQNINETVVQIPNLMAKMPNFVLPQSPQLTAQRQDHLQNQQAAQILINGTLLKLANTMTSTYPNIPNVNKQAPITSQSISGMNKNISGMPPVGMTVQSKPNYTVNFSHPVLMPQPGYIVTSVPNMNVKETWSYTNTNTLSSSQISCSNPIVHHPSSMMANFTSQALHTNSIPIAPVKPPDNPIQGTEPPSSTVMEPHEVNEVTSSKCDIPWLSKTVNNNIVPLDTKISSRPFAQVSLSEKFDKFAMENLKEMSAMNDDNRDVALTDHKGDKLRKVEEVARREETIFTQITVLKDVSSNVQSTVIEANYSSATTESSESGIGTDKSIDSPSDSQTSKDCDDDSSLSLSVSVCSMDVQSSQKSPILKQPKTLRFPPRNLTKTDSDRRTSSTDTTSTVTLCLWEDCKSEFESDTDLLEHLQSVHVEPQAGKENYVCLWQRCKVRGKPSCSRLWLERHALSHGGNKPFKCIVDGCDRRFSTQILLERHVNNHFNEASPNSSGGKKTADSAAKLIRRNGKKLRYRRQPWSARMFDFFDAGTMEGLAWRLARVTRWRIGGACPLREPAGRHTLTLHAALAATRYNAAAARTEALLTYYPPHVIEDEWVPEKEVRRVKRVELSQLPAATKVLVYEQFCAAYRRVPATPRRPRAAAAAVASANAARALANLLACNQRAAHRGLECRSECTAPVPLYRAPPAPAPRVSGAKKRKMGRRHGGDCFWPSGR